MIYESAPWREQLIKDAALIEKWASKQKITERRSFIIEKKVFLVAYIIRKLFEARKLSSSSDSKSIKCAAFPAFDRNAISPWNAYKFDELYDMSHPSSQTINIRNLMDLIIHSLIFCESLRENDTIDGFLITSDKKRSTLWSIDLRRFISVM